MKHVVINLFSSFVKLFPKSHFWAVTAVDVIYTWEQIKHVFVYINYETEALGIIVFYLIFPLVGVGYYFALCCCEWLRNEIDRTIQYQICWFKLTAQKSFSENAMSFNKLTCGTN